MLFYDFPYTGCFRQQRVDSSSGQYSSSATKNIMYTVYAAYSWNWRITQPQGGGRPMVIQNKDHRTVPISTPSVHILCKRKNIGHSSIRDHSVVIRPIWGVIRPTNCSSFIPSWFSFSSYFTTNSFIMFTYHFTFVLWFLWFQIDLMTTGHDQTWLVI